MIVSIGRISLDISDKYSYLGWSKIYDVIVKSGVEKSYLSKNMFKGPGVEYRIWKDLYDWLMVIMGK